MCGRFSQAYTWDEIVAFSQPLTVPADRPNLQARYNIAPTTEVDIIVLTEAGRELRKARWGLIPGWHKGGLKDFKLATFNARASKPSRRAARSSTLIRADAASFRPQAFSNGPARRKIACRISSRLPMAICWLSPAFTSAGAIPRPAKRSRHAP